MDKTMLRYLIAAALLASLAACGNKGPLVKASQAVPADAQVAPVDAQSPPAGDPTEVTPPDEVPPPVTEPVSTPPDVPPADAGGGNG